MTIRFRHPDISLAVALIGCLALFVMCVIVSGTKPFWFDEVLTYFPVKAASLGDVIKSNREPMNTAPPFYFLFGWFYVRLFGASELSLRIISPVCFSLALMLMWRLLRQRMSATATSFAFLGTISVTTILSQIAEARFYGMYFFFAAVLFYLFVVQSEVRHDSMKQRTRNTSALFVLFVNLLLVFTHTFGLLFSATLVMTQLILDFSFWRSSRSSFLEAFRPEIYVASVTSWGIFLLLWGQVIVSQQRAFNGVGNIEAASISLLIRVLFDESALRKVICCLPIALFLMALYILIKREIVHRKSHPEEASPDVRSIFAANNGNILAFGISYFLLAPGITYVVSLLGTSIFAHRYLLPHWIGWMVVVAWTIDVIQKQQTPARMLWFRGAAIGYCALFVLTFAIKFKELIGEGKATTVGIRRIESALAPLHGTAGTENRLPVLYSDSMLYVPAYYKGGDRALYMVNDLLWSDTQNNEYVYTASVNLVGVKKNFPFFSILTEEELNKRYPEFILCDTKYMSFHDRFFATNPRYRTRMIQTINVSDPRNPVYLYYVALR